MVNVQVKRVAGPGRWWSIARTWLALAGLAVLAGCATGLNEKETAALLTGDLAADEGLVLAHVRAAGYQWTHQYVRIAAPSGESRHLLGVTGPDFHPVLLKVKVGTLRTDPTAAAGLPGGVTYGVPALQTVLVQGRINYIGDLRYESLGLGKAQVTIINNPSTAEAARKRYPALFEKYPLQEALLKQTAPTGGR